MKKIWRRIRNARFAIGVKLAITVGFAGLSFVAGQPILGALILCGGCADIAVVLTADPQPQVVVLAA